MSVAFYIPNHSSSELRKAELSALPTLSRRPDFPSKKEFAAWCHDKSTDHVFYVLAEPQNATMRSSGQNPVKYLHGVVADYDGAADVVQKALTKWEPAAGKAPTWVTTTFSGKARLVWAFERPVPVFNSEVMGKFMSILARTLNVKNILPGLDEGAWGNPHTPYELGTRWRQPWGDVQLSSSLVMTAIYDASEKAKWKSDDIEIPLEVVAAEVDRRWPGRWTGPFVEGARGPRFWADAADNPTGCTLRAAGVQAWTGEARFMPWSEILGSEFTKKYRENRIGGAIDGVYYDGMHYWERDAAGIWQAFSGQQMSRRLTTEHGLSNDTRRTPVAETAKALSVIENVHRVDGAFPCLYLPEVVVQDQHSTYLNISRVSVAPGTGTPREWGDGFSWTANYLSGLFDRQQLDVLLSWVAHAYQNAAAAKPKKGHALFIAGDASAGKTFLSQFVIGGLLGGHQEATNYIVGGTNFNEQLFFHPVWTVDDATVGSDSKRHALYSAAVKKFVANPYQEFHPKFKKAVTHKFNGRLIITLNRDASSITMLPQIEGSIRDKLVILCANKADTDFANCEDHVRSERAAFADFVSGWRIPDWLKSRRDEVNRFGHDSWHHPEMLEIASDASPSASLRETIEAWRIQYFRQAKEDKWFGSASDLVTEIQSTDTLRGQLPRVADLRNHVKQHLYHLCEQRLWWLAPHRTNHKRGFTIAKPIEAELP